MKRFILVALLGLASLSPAPAAIPDRIAIAPPAQALTFARIAGTPHRRVLAVTAYGGGEVTGIDLTKLLGYPVDDPLTLFGEAGYDTLLQAVQGDAADAASATYPQAALLQPVDLGAHHVAAGTNFAAHADESEVDDGPFLFPKLVVPTPSRAPVSASGRLLDYEVELCFVTLSRVLPRVQPQHWGLLLCNDYTDRALLLRSLDPGDVASGRGFTTGKSFPGALPVGDLFVVPRDVRAFAEGVLLRLYRNGELRQEAPFARAIWDLDELLRQTWQRAGTTWEHEGRQVGLSAEPGALAARTLIVSGTPDGTIFRGIPLLLKLRGLSHWLLGGFERGLPATVIETYVDDAWRAGDYLRPGETVTIRVEQLGTIENRIEP